MTAGLWNESWNGRPGNSSAIRALDAICRVICAGHAISAREHASRNAPLAGFRLAVASSFRPHTGTLRSCQPSLGYEHHHGCLCAIKLSSLPALARQRLQREVVSGPLHLLRLGELVASRAQFRAQIWRLTCWFSSPRPAAYRRQPGPKTGGFTAVTPAAGALNMTCTDATVPLTGWRAYPTYIPCCAAIFCSLLLPTLVVGCS